MQPEQADNYKTMTIFDRKSSLKGKTQGSFLKPDVSNLFVVMFKTAPIFKRFQDKTKINGTVNGNKSTLMIVPFRDLAFFLKYLY